MFTPILSESEGAIFVASSENRIFTSVHTIGMRSNIGIVWLDKNGTVVDKVFARPWRLFHLPKSPARYYIESTPSLLDRAQIGDRLVFDKETP